MPKLSLAFFATAALCAIAGMIWGIQMGMTENFTLAPAHAHLNLVGWATLALMGAFYALAGERAHGRVGWINYFLSAGGAAVMIPSLAVLLSTTNKVNPGIIVGSVLTLAGMIVFLWSVISVWRKSAPA